MKAVILNSGLGHRMGVLTSEHPKCMTEISPTDTILSRQLKLIAAVGIEEVVMTTGYFDSVPVNYCKSLDLPLKYKFVKKPLMPFPVRKVILENITGINKVIEQKSLSYVDVLHELRPNYLLHEDSWKSGSYKKYRDEAISILAEYGGKLVEHTCFSSVPNKKL